MKYIFLFLLTTVILFGQDLNKSAEELLNIDKLTHAQWSGYACYVETAEPVMDINGGSALAPASGLKLFTTAAAIDILGADYKYETCFYLSENNRELYIIAGGDPTLGSNRVKGSMKLTELTEMIFKQLKENGVKELDKLVIVDNYYDDIAIPEHWIWMDIGNYYGAGPTAFSLNDNLYELYFDTSGKPGDIAKVKKTIPEIKYLSFTNYMETGKKGSGDNGYIYCAPRQYNAVLRGSVPAGQDEFSIKGSIPDPVKFGLEYFSNSFTDSGIKVKNTEHNADGDIDLTKMKKLKSVYSPSLQDIVEVINKQSFNLYAEHMVRAISKKAGFNGNYKKGLAYIKEYFTDNGVDTDGLILCDGSGLSRTNAIPPKVMVSMLKYMANSDKSFIDYYSTIATAGDPNDMGGFKSFGKGTIIAYNARIKSGYVGGVRSHSGYVKDKNGKLIAFSFIANNFEGSTGPVNELHKNLMILLAEQK